MKNILMKNFSLWEIYNKKTKNENAMISHINYTHKLPCMCACNCTRMHLREQCDKNKTSLLIRYYNLFSAPNFGILFIIIVL